MKRIILLALTFSLIIKIYATGPIIEGESARVHFLALAVSKAPPELEFESMIRLLCLVSPKSMNQGKFIIEETRDALIDGQSYSELTQAALGRAFEPKTHVHEATKFFETSPQLRPKDQDVSNSKVVIINLPGSAIPKGKSIDSWITVGFGPKVERFELNSSSFNRD